MSEHGSPASVNWRQAASEALLIFLGVALALFGQAWWEDRSDRELEQHLLEGIRSDLSRDSADAASAILAAKARIVGADRLLAHVQDPDAGVLRPVPWEPGPGMILLGTNETLDRALADYESVDISPQRALYMVAVNASMQSLDLSDASFNEATASGQLNVIRDAQLRTAIADYYFTSGRFGSTTDSRVVAHWQLFREVLAEAGLSAIGGESDQGILTTLQTDRRLLAELKNVRDFAVFQVGAHSRVLESAEELISRLNGSSAQ